MVDAPLQFERQPQDLLPDLSRQHQIGRMITAVGIIILLIGAFLLSRVDNRTPLTEKNIYPLIALAGLVITAQGLLLLRLHGKKMVAWLLAIPTVVFILTVVIFPTLYAFGLSFVRWDIQVREQSFIFLENYRTLFDTARVWGAMWNTLLIAVSAVITQMILGVGLAVLLRDSFPGRSIVVSIILIPMMMAPVVVGQTWRMLWDARFGAVNDILGTIIGQEITLLWLSDPQLAIVAIVITDVWQWTPFIFLIALAGMIGINVELYEVAAIDGASPWVIFWRVTLPLLRPVLLVGLLFRLLDALKIFDLVFILTNGGPGYSTENFSFYLYQQGFSFGRFGYSAAGSIFFMVVVIVIAMFLIRRIGER